MKVRKLKTRIAAFGLAVLMGISTLSSVNAFAVEQTGSEQQTEVQAVTSQKDTSVTADDITKAVSDETFAVETCMEGIHYDAEKEDVTLVSIKDENGGEYHSDKAGTYIATYMVVPKDKSDSYTITRKVTLTDTEGQAHSEENGGEKQKSDTESEDDSDSPVQNYTDVEIETSEEDASAQAVKELKEDIEEGNVMVLSAAERATSSGSTVTLTKGRTIYYPSYIGNYLTCLFTVNGKIAYCLQSQKASPPSGSYVAQVLDSNKNLQKVLYYGYGGAGDLTGSYLSGKTEDEKYVYTHIAASYAYAGEAGFTGCNYNDLVNAGVIAYINYLFGQEEPPKGELSLSSTKLNAVRDGNIQKTPNITLSGDHRNYVTLSVPENVTAHNLSKGTSVTNGKIQIYGGDTFYLSADLLLTGSYASGNLYGSVGKTWRTLVLTTGNSKQDIGVFESETAAPVSFSVQWLNMTRIELMYRQLMLQPEEEARGLALSSELFINGSLNTFAQPTNVNKKNRIMDYDIRELGEQLMPLGMLVTLDSIFNRVIQNWKEGKTTWIFADEFYLLFRYEYSANFFYRLYKRIRKYNGFVTGLTQNVEELLKSDTARLMLANSEFLILLNQASTDREELAALLNISENQLSYITNVSVGSGLIRCSGNIVPFENTFPKNTDLYKLMTTKPGES